MYISTNIAHTIQVIIDVASIDFKAENNYDGTQNKVAKHQNTCCFFKLSDRLHFPPFFTFCLDARIVFSFHLLTTEDYLRNKNDFEMPNIFCTFK